MIGIGDVVDDALVPAAVLLAVGGIDRVEHADAGVLHRHVLLHAAGQDPSLAACPRDAMARCRSRRASEAPHPHEGLDRAALVHRGVRLADPVEVGFVVQDAARIDAAGENVIE